MRVASPVEYGRSAVTKYDVSIKKQKVPPYHLQLNNNYFLVIWHAQILLKNNFQFLRSTDLQLCSSDRSLRTIRFATHQFNFTT